MANSFWNFVTTFAAGTLAKAEDVNTNFSGIQTGFDSVEADIGGSIQVTNAPGVTDITGNAAARALKFITFDSDGDIVTVDDIGDWQGNHAGSTAYVERDLVKDAAADLGLNNIYRCNTAHTSTADMSDNTAKWDLVIDVAAVVAAQVAAEAAQTAAETAETNAETAQTAAELAETNAAASEAAIDGYDFFTYLGGSHVLDFDDANMQEIQVTNPITFGDAVNMAAGKKFTLILRASGGTRGITYNASWHQIGTLPTTLLVNEHAVLNFNCIGLLQTDILISGGQE